MVESDAASYTPLSFLGRRDIPFGIAGVATALALMLVVRALAARLSGNVDLAALLLPAATVFTAVGLVAASLFSSKRAFMFAGLSFLLIGLPSYGTAAWMQTTSEAESAAIFLILVGGVSLLAVVGAALYRIGRLGASPA